MNEKCIEAIVERRGSDITTVSGNYYHLKTGTKLHI